MVGSISRIDVIYLADDGRKILQDQSPGGALDALP